MLEYILQHEDAHKNVKCIGDEMIPFRPIQSHLFLSKLQEWLLAEFLREISISTLHKLHTTRLQLPKT
ncbi:hypothetical protein MAR_029213 [Mya arenaria]|uniref:Uncharacterized protein n=1 Tax=Mya arenaria TaxID=6604 RepID=A0ABY7DKA4_MYAAR|nr:hypothetical protein MAR_029213 [Mya arenaria]